jgi:hypothetical protein
MLGFSAAITGTVKNRVMKAKKAAIRPLYLLKRAVIIPLPYTQERLLMLINHPRKLHHPLP